MYLETNWSFDSARSTRATALMCFNNSQLLILIFSCCTLLCFNCYHHAANLPLNFVATKKTLSSSRTSLKSNISFTAATQSKNYLSCKQHSNSSMSSLNPASHLLMLFSTKGCSLLALRLCKQINKLILTLKSSSSSTKRRFGWWQRPLEPPRRQFVQLTRQFDPKTGYQSLSNQTAPLSVANVSSTTHRMLSHRTHTHRQCLHTYFLLQVLFCVPW